MARVTVEDCIVKVPNRFELILMATQRARELSNSASSSGTGTGDKNPVRALREIAEGSVDLPKLRDSIIRVMQTKAEREEPDIVITELSPAEQAFLQENKNVAVDWNMEEPDDDGDSEIKSDSEFSDEAPEAAND